MMSWKLFFQIIKLFIWVIIVVFTIADSSIAQNISEDIILGKTITIQSKILKEERPVFIYTPAGYNNSQQKYPVFYLLDGGTHFLHTTGITQFLSTLGRMPRMIIIAIPNTDRNRDFTPTKTEDTARSGGADNFLDFMEKELIPYVEKNFRVRPYRIFFGHSLTGLFAIHTFATRSDLFNAYIAASPYLMYDNEIVIDEIDSFLEKFSNINKFLYITIGNEPDYFTSLDKINNLLNKNAPSDLRWKYEKMESEDHGSVPHKTIYNALEFLYSDWRISNSDLAKGITGIKRHYSKLSKEFGYQIDAPEFLLNQLGYRYLNQGRINDAVATFKLNVEKYPNSANVYDSLGEAYETAGQLEHAEINYEIAFNKGKEISDPNLQIYKNNLDRISKKLSKRAQAYKRN